MPDRNQLQEAFAEWDSGLSEIVWQQVSDHSRAVITVGFWAARAWLEFPTPDLTPEAIRAANEWLDEYVGDFYDDFEQKDQEAVEALQACVNFVALLSVKETD